MLKEKQKKMMRRSTKERSAIKKYVYMHAFYYSFLFIYFLFFCFFYRIASESVLCVAVSLYRFRCVCMYATLDVFGFLQFLFVSVNFSILDLIENCIVNQPCFYSNFYFSLIIIKYCDRSIVKKYFVYSFLFFIFLEPHQKYI